jgi:hypothetical protein
VSSLSAAAGSEPKGLSSIFFVSGGASGGAGEGAVKELIANNQVK